MRSGLSSQVTKPYYDYLGVTAEPITDGMPIPWVGDKLRGTIWAVAHQSRDNFDIGSYELLNTLAGSISIAGRHQVQEEAPRKQAADAATAAKTNELAHKLIALCRA
jgi:hypothetical protein